MEESSDGRRSKGRATFRAAVDRGWRALGRLAHIPADPAILDEHRRTVTTRTMVATWVAAVVMPVTIFVYFAGREGFEVSLVASLLADGTALGTLVLLRTPFAREHYHVPFFLLVGVVCSGTEAVLLQISGGGRASDFLFPYFLILFGVATLFPARFAWAFAASLMAPATYLASELYTWHELAPGRPRLNLVLLLNSAFIAVIGNRMATRSFFREVEQRRELELANERLLELDKAKREFFANVSHDLRTPLNVIIGPVQVVHRNSALDNRSRRYLEMALRGAKRLDGMINDLLDLARIEAGVVALNLQHADIRELLANHLEATSAYAATVGQKVELETPETPVFADVDPDKLERVVANLVSNALKFSSAGSKVRVGLRDLGDDLEIAVTDQGPGISPADQQRIFARFARASGDGPRPRGAGIGLSVVREFVELHHGRVTVESEPGKGSTFRVRLPRHLGEGLPQAPVPRPERRPAPEPEPADMELKVRPLDEPPRVLLVEDDDETRSFLTSELGRGMEVLAAPDAQTALRMAELRPDLAILDVSLPGQMDGLETCRRLRQYPPTSRMPIIIYSARGDLATRLRAFELGADDFVHKPVEALELRARVESLLRRAAASPVGLNHPG